MKDHGLINHADIDEYAKALSTADSSIAEEIIAYTLKHTEGAHMVSGPLVMRLLQMLMKLNQAQNILDIGTFTGYSAISFAEALIEGKVYTCEQDADILAVAQQFFAKSPHGKKIEVIQGDALDFLKATPLFFDLIFVDADKKRLRDYYEAALTKLTKRGILVIDDVLWRGEVVAPKTERALRIHEFNEYIHQDARVLHLILPIRHGLQIVMLAESDYK